MIAISQLPTVPCAACAGRPAGGPCADDAGAGHPFGAVLSALVRDASGGTGDDPGTGAADDPGADDDPAAGATAGDPPADAPSDPPAGSGAVPWGIPVVGQIVLVEGLFPGTGVGCDRAGPGQVDRVVATGAPAGITPVGIDWSVAGTAGPSAGAGGSAIAGGVPGGGPADGSGTAGNGDGTAGGTGTADGGGPVAAGRAAAGAASGAVALNAPVPASPTAPNGAGGAGGAMGASGAVGAGATVAGAPPAGARADLPGGARSDLPGGVGTRTAGQTDPAGQTDSVGQTGAAGLGGVHPAGSDVVQGGTGAGGPLPGAGSDRWAREAGTPVGAGSTGPAPTAPQPTAGSAPAAPPPVTTGSGPAGPPPSTADTLDPAARHRLDPGGSHGGTEADTTATAGHATPATPATTGTLGATTASAPAAQTTAAQTTATQTTATLATAGSVPVASGAPAGSSGPSDPSDPDVTGGSASATGTGAVDAGKPAASGGAPDTTLPGPPAGAGGTMAATAPSGTGAPARGAPAAGTPDGTVTRTTADGAADMTTVLPRGVEGNGVGDPRADLTIAGLGVALPGQAAGPGGPDGSRSTGTAAEDPPGDASMGVGAAVAASRPAPGTPAEPPRPGQASPTATPTPADQLAVHLTPLRRGPDGVHRMTMHLHPEELGPVRIIAEIRGGEIAVRLASSTDAGRAALAAALPELRRELADAGFSGCALDLQQEAPGQSRHHGRGPEQPASQAAQGDAAGGQAGDGTRWGGSEAGGSRATAEAGGRDPATQSPERGRPRSAGTRTSRIVDLHV